MKVQARATQTQRVVFETEVTEVTLTLSKDEAELVVDALNFYADDAGDAASSIAEDIMDAIRHPTIATENSVTALEYTR